MKEKKVQRQKRERERERELHHSRRDKKKHTLRLKMKEKRVLSCTTPRRVLVCQLRSVHTGAELLQRDYKPNGRWKIKILSLIHTK